MGNHFVCAPRYGYKFFTSINNFRYFGYLGVLQIFVDLRKKFFFLLSINKYQNDFGYQSNLLWLIDILQ